MTTQDDHDKNLRILDGVALAAAEDAAEDPITSASERAAGRRLAAFATTRIAELRRAELATIAPSTIAPVTVRPSILAMARDAIVARLGEIATQFPTLAVAHHKLDERAPLTDDALRAQLEDAERAIAAHDGGTA